MRRERKKERERKGGERERVWCPFLSQRVKEKKKKNHTGPILKTGQAFMQGFYFPNHDDGFNKILEAHFIM